MRERLLATHGAIRVSLDKAEAGQSEAMTPVSRQEQETFLRDMVVVKTFSAVQK